MISKKPTGTSAGTITRTSTALLADLMSSSGQSEAWHGIVGRYRPLITRYARRLGAREDIAEDAAQQTLLAFCDAYRAGKYDREKGRLRSWLFGIATRQIRNELRQRRVREVQVPGSSVGTGFFERIQDDDDCEKVWEDEWRLALFRQCFNEVRKVLDSNTIQAFELFARQGWAASRVADHLGMSENAVFLARHRVVRRIRELLPKIEQTW